MKRQQYIKSRIEEAMKKASLPQAKARKKLHYCDVCRDDRDHEPLDSGEMYCKECGVVRSKALKKEEIEHIDESNETHTNIGGAKVKNDPASILKHIQKTFPNVKKVRKDPQHGWVPAFVKEEEDLDEKFDPHKHKHPRGGRVFTAVNPFERNEKGNSRLETTFKPNGRGRKSYVVATTHDNEEAEKNKHEYAKKFGYEAMKKYGLKEEEDLDEASRKVPHNYAAMMAKKRKKAGTSEFGPHPDKEQAHDSVKAGPKDRSGSEPKWKPQTKWSSPPVGQTSSRFSAPFRKEEVEEMREEDLYEAPLTAKQVKAGISVARRYRDNMTGAVRSMSKINKRLPHHPAVARELQKQNEELEGLDESSHDPQVTVHDNEGLHTHAALSTANKIHKTNVKHEDLLRKKHVIVRSGHPEEKSKLKFALSPYGSKSMREEVDSDEKHEMAQTQLYFIEYAAAEILEYIDMGGNIEEWYQNKLSKVHSDMEGLHSFVEGEKRRLGMVKDD